MNTEEQNIQLKIEQLQQEKETALINGNFEMAATLRDRIRHYRESLPQKGQLSKEAFEVIELLEQWQKRKEIAVEKEDYDELTFINHTISVYTKQLEDLMNPTHD